MISEIDLSEMSGVNCYCSDEAAVILRERASEAGYRGIHLLGSGNYHYLSLFFLELIKEDFSLLLIDHHPDCEKGAFEDGDSSILSCGNWVRVAKKKVKNLKKAYCFGTDEGLFSEALRDDPSIQGFVFLIKDPSEIEKGLPLYLSIDKDALSQEFCVTDWDQGDMSFSTLSGFLKETGKEHFIIGADICGNTMRPASSDIQEKNKDSDQKVIDLLFEAFSFS